MSGGKLKMIIQPKTKQRVMKFYFFVSMFTMFIGVLFSISSAMSLNDNALNEHYPIDLYRFTEAHFLVGISFFVLGLFLILVPIICDWYASKARSILEHSIQKIETT